MIKNLSLLLLLFSTFLFNIKAQNVPEEALAKFSEEFPQEKIHLLLNKKSFIVGEDIYFKAMISDGFQPSTISTTLFVELYDANKKLLIRKVCPVLLGETFGNIPLSKDWKEDVYYLRAYTTWSTNFSEKFQYLKGILIYNSQSSKKLTLNKNLDWNVTVHPESGNFINNVKTKVAVRMHTNGTYPEKWSGYIIDEKNPSVKIAEFNALDENVGTFNMTPQAGKIYKLIATDNSGKKKTVVLPFSKDDGIILEVESQTGGIICTPKFKNLPSSSYFKIIGQINNKLVFSTKMDAFTNDKSFKIPTTNLINGVLQITIFNDKNEVLAERLTFVDAKKLSLGKVNISKSELKTDPKGFNLISLNTKSSSVNYSALVSDGSIESSEDDDSLLSTMWLTGDFRERISKPAQYFSQNSNAEALEALLMTEKWERFNWNQIIAGNFQRIFNKNNSYICYSGKAMVNGAPFKDKTIDLMITSTDTGSQMSKIKTGNDGTFTINNMIFDEPLDVFYSAKGDDLKKGEKLTVIFQPLVNPSALKSNLPENPYILTENIAEVKQAPEVKRAMQDMTFNKKYSEKVALIEAVIIKANRKELSEKLNKRLSSPSFRAINETVIDLVNDYERSSIDIMSFIDGKIAGVNVERENGDKILKVRGETAYIYIDENPSSARELSTLTLDKVAMIKLIKPPFQGTNKAVLAVYLRNGELALQNQKRRPGDPLPALGFRNLKGYDKNDVFPTIDYQKTTKDNLTEDSRLTLFWNPFIPSSKYEAGTIKFFNNDVAKSYNITVIGYDEDAQQYIYYHDTIAP